MEFFLIFIMLEIHHIYLHHPHSVIKGNYTLSNKSFDYWKHKNNNIVVNHLEKCGKVKYVKKKKQKHSSHD